VFSGSSEAHHCRGVIDGLAFLPIVDLPVAMSYLHRNIPDVDRVAELVTYFDNTYVSGTVRRPNTDADDGRLLLRLTRSPPLFPAGLERSRVNRQRDGPNEQRQRGVEPCVRVHGWPQPSLRLEDPGRPPAELGACCHVDSARVTKRRRRGEPPFSTMIGCADSAWRVKKDARASWRP